MLPAHKNFKNLNYQKIDWTNIETMTPELINQIEKCGSFGFTKESWNRNKQKIIQEKNRIVYLIKDGPKVLGFVNGTLQSLSDHYTDLKFLTFIEKQQMLKGKLSQKEIDILLNYLAIAKKLGWINTINYLIICKGFEDIKAGLPKQEQKDEKPLKEKEKEPAEPAGAIKSAKLSGRQQKIVDFLSNYPDTYLASVKKQFLIFLNDFLRNMIKCQKCQGLEEFLFRATIF